MKTRAPGVTGPAQNQLNNVYDAGAIATALRYGTQYDFRVRMRDLSGGGAEPDESRRSKAHRRSGAVISSAMSRRTSRASPICR